MKWKGNIDKKKLTCLNILSKYDYNGNCKETLCNRHDGYWFEFVKYNLFPNI